VNRSSRSEVPTDKSSKSKVPTDRSSRFEVPTDRSSADLRYQQADLVYQRY
jgi:hypothetical protein